MDIEPKEGTPSDMVYLVTYDEDQWNRYDEAGKQFCYDFWIKRAEPLGVGVVVLRLIPDPIFPSGAHTTIYTAWQHRFDRKPKVPFTVNGAVFLTMAEGITSLDVPTRNLIEATMYQYPNGTKYQVVTNDGKTSLLQGKVSK